MINMKKEKTLLIMAAGLGSRFGGLKQLEKVGPNGEYIIDYSIYDAIRAGFTKVVFVIKEEMLEEFKETIGRRIEPFIKVDYAFQNNDYIPSRFNPLLKKRTKPLGTAYAIYCAKDKINEPFIVINADDFYGLDAFLKASEYLDNIIYNHYGIVAYKLINTLSPNGVCKRGIMEVGNNKLSKITECKVVAKKNKIVASSLYSNNGIEIDEDTLVSMNLLVFSPDIFDILNEELSLFLSLHQKNLDDFEFQIPDILDTCLKKNIKTIDVIKTTSTWYGMTYKEDQKDVEKAIKDLIEKGVYKEKLWITI